MTAKTTLVATLAALCFTAGLAAAAPRLAGTYTMTTTQVCQARGAKTVPTARGSITHTLATAVVSAGKMTMSGTTQSGPMFDAGTKPFARQSFTDVQTIAVTGTANPYALKMTKSNGTSKVFQAYLDEVDALGIAHSTTFVFASSDGPVANDCVSRMSLISH